MVSAGGGSRLCKSSVSSRGCYLIGEGVSKNFAAAVKWYRKAAEQGDSMAQVNLGLRYYTGEGVPKDYVQAYKWLNLAAGQRNEDAKRFLNLVENSMTTEQIAEGQQLAREFKPSKPPKSGASVSGENIIGSSPEASGTGFFITEDGYLISNYHVVKDSAQVRLVTSAGFIAAKVVRWMRLMILRCSKRTGDLYRCQLLPVAR